jgi:hypothetical protein
MLQPKENLISLWKTSSRIWMSVLQHMPPTFATRGWITTPLRSGHLLLGQSEHQEVFFYSYFSSFVTELRLPLSIGGSYAQSHTTCRQDGQFLGQ